MDAASSTTSEKEFESTTTGEAANEHTNTSNSSVSLVRAETTAVKRSKHVVLVILALAASGIGFATHTLLENEERRDFRTEFLSSCKEVAEMSAFQAKSFFKTIDALSVSITSYALDSYAQWPFVTVPNFDTRGSHFNDFAESHIVAFSPVVPNDKKQAWEEYSVKKQHLVFKDKELPVTFTKGIQGNIHPFDDAEEPLKQYENNADFLPAWQISPTPFDNRIINKDLLSNSFFNQAYRRVEMHKHPILTQVYKFDWLYNSSFVHEDAAELPDTLLIAPIYGEFYDGDEAEQVNNAKDMKGVLFTVLQWDHFFLHLLSEGVDGFIIVLHWNCGEEINNEDFGSSDDLLSFTYEINGPEANFLGFGDFHDTAYDGMEVRQTFTTFSDVYNLSRDECKYDMYMYPSRKFEEVFHHGKPAIYTVGVLLVFGFTTLVFIVYDILVERRQDKVMYTAVRANAIVNSIFPSNVRDRIMEDVDTRADTGKTHQGLHFGPAAKRQLKSFLDDGQSKDQKTFAYDSRPIADLFPSATIMFADIVGFTAWSSEREPPQVFQLLETIYHGFDEITARRRIFKVETVGDCYVAVAGLPEARKDHASTMCRAAMEYMATTNDLTKKLEVVLGPGTGDLTLRVGIHSGPVTAGVLRGEKSRFQLFGDTVNTASRMETTGLKNKIQISSETANLLTQAGKSHWFRQRKDKVTAKGKGELVTYILDIKVHSSLTNSGSTTSGQTDQTKTDREDRDTDKPVGLLNGRCSLEATDTQAGTPFISLTNKRLVHWSTELLSQYLKHIVARRDAKNKHIQQISKALRKPKSLGISSNCSTSSTFDLNNRSSRDERLTIDEVKEIIELPMFDPEVARLQDDIQNITLDDEVVKQLLDFVYTIASMYRDNPFHNFEHASHVTMSVVKLLSRIVAPDEILHTIMENDQDVDEIVRNLHDHTYGITSDPLTQFAVVFSALVHDVDHTGLPNAQLVKEESPLAIYYRNQSVAEQNSVDLSWDVLMDERFSKLLSTICATETEIKRLRQLVVNVVMATDIVDKELKQLRNDRWDKAFCRNEQDKMIKTDASSKDNINRKATVVIEHLIQASDVAHTMQHWHIYVKWNEKFFEENLLAYRSGKASVDPTEFWYKGEIGFFEFYIIPLAKKLKECGVFGVSSDEYLQYATENLTEWKLKGQSIVAEWIEKYKVESEDNE